MGYMLSAGSHRDPSEGRCAMEWVAFLAGEPHSAHPMCVSPMLRAFFVALNDGLGLAARQKLRPYLARTIGTRGDGHDRARAWMAADWLVRTWTPAWLDGVMPAAAAELRDSLPITNAAGLRELAASLDDLRVQVMVMRVDVGMRSPRGMPKAMWLWSPMVELLTLALEAASTPSLHVCLWDISRDAAAILEARREPIETKPHELQRDLLRPGGLVDRLLPTVPVEMPVLAEWREVCALAA